MFRCILILLLLCPAAFGVLAITASDTSPESVDEAVFLSASGYFSTASTLSWDFGDGTVTWPEYGVSMLHYYKQPGTYTVTLTETSTEPATYSDTETITVGGSWRKYQPRPSTDPVLWLKFEDNLTDSSGNGNNGTYVPADAEAAAYLAAGAENKAFDLTTSGSYITIADSATLDAFTNGLTISYWAKQNAGHNAVGYTISKSSCYTSRIYDGGSQWIFNGGISVPAFFGGSATISDSGGLALLTKAGAFTVANIAAVEGSIYLVPSGGYSSGWYKPIRVDDNTATLTTMADVPVAYVAGSYTAISGGSILSQVYTTTASAYPVMHSLGWHHYVVVYNNTGSSIDGVANNYSAIYIDGIEVVSDSTKSPLPVYGNGNIANNANALTIGAASGGWNGYIDEVKIWNTPLTKAQIANGFESWHAPFYNRESQYVYYQIPGDITETATNTLTVVLAGTGVSDTLVNLRASLSSEESVLINWGGYSANTFTLTATLKNAGGDTLETIIEDFYKGYNGVSRISIDRYNNLLVDGSKVLPVGSWLAAAGHYSALVGRASYGYGHSYTTDAGVDNYRTQIEAFNAGGRGNVGPIRYPSIVNRNLPVTAMDAYYDAIYTGMTNPSSVWGWAWVDEPDLVTVTPNIYGTPTVASWHEYSHGAGIALKGDYNTPMWLNVQGLSFVDPPGTTSTNPLRTEGNTFMWKYTDRRLGKKVSAAEVTGIDYYPYDYRLKAGTLATVEKYLTALDNLAIAEPYTPHNTFIETWDIGVGTEDTVSITQPQLEALVWLSIIHGCKSVCWFPQHISGAQHGPTPASADEDICEPIYTEVQSLKDAILGNPSSITCTDNRDTYASGGRVDTLVKTDGVHYYIFSARVSEIDDSGSISCTFTLSDNTITRAIEVVGESRSVSCASGVFSDTFEVNGTHVYRFMVEANPQAIFQ